MSESTLTRAFCRALEAQGAMTYPLVGNYRAPPGFPDRFIAHKVIPGGMFVEFKVEGGCIDARQAHVINGLRERGVRAEVVVLRLEAGVGGFALLGGDWHTWGEFLGLVTKL